MKKLSKFSLLIVLLLIPVNVFACPHSDSNDELHLQTYNGDYTEVTMIYPKENYLYAKECYMEIVGSSYTIDEENILKEQFGFPIYQDATSYITYYWFLDQSLLETELDELDEDITVENYDSLYVVGDGYNLEVGLTNTYKNGITYINDLSYQIYYEVNVDKLNNDENYLSLIEKYELSLLSEDIIKIDAQYMITEESGFTYETEYKDIANLYDEIIVSYYSEEYSENAVVVNLSEINSDDFIGVSYSDNYYTFTIDSSSVYVIADYTEISEEDGYVTPDDVVVFDTTNTEVEPESVNYTLYIIIGVAAVIVLTTTIIILSKKKKA